MNKHKLAILSVVLVCLVILSCPLSYASAANIDPTVNSPEINLHLNNAIGFVMQKNPQPIGLSTSIKGKTIPQMCTVVISMLFPLGKGFLIIHLR